VNVLLNHEGHKGAQKKSSADLCDFVSFVVDDFEHHTKNNEGQVSRKDVPDPGLRLTSTWSE